MNIHEEFPVAARLMEDAKLQIEALDAMSVQSTGPVDYSEVLPVVTSEQLASLQSFYDFLGGLLQETK